MLSSFDTHDLSTLPRKNQNTQTNWTSRSLFSMYVPHAYNEIKRAVHLAVNEVKEDAAHIKKVNVGFEITDATGRIVRSRRVITCLGAKSADKYKDISSAPGFIGHFPQYPESSKSLLVAGTGLTVSDAICTQVGQLEYKTFLQTWGLANLYDLTE